MTAGTLAGRVALVTGSTEGIGFGIAERLLASGATVALHGLGTPDALQAVRARLACADRPAVTVDGADLADPAAAGALIGRTLERHGRLDILINNAGVQHTAPLDRFGDAEWDRVIGINLSAPFRLMRAAIPLMRARGWGRIVNVASAHALVGSAEKPAYVAAKHGLLGLTRSAAIELAPSGITVNAVCPGWVRTALVDAQLDRRAARSGRSADAEAASLLAEKQPMTRFTTPSAIGGLVVFLCSEDAATVTGSAYPIDGGWTAQ